MKLTLEELRKEALTKLDYYQDSLNNYNSTPGSGLKISSCVDKLSDYKKNIVSANNKLSINIVRARAKFYYNSVLKHL